MFKDVSMQFRRHTFPNYLKYSHNSSWTLILMWKDGLPFLNTLTKPTLSSIESTVYRKPTHTDRYLDYSSNHPISTKLSVIHTLIHRAKQVCSTPEFPAKNGSPSESPRRQPLPSIILSTGLIPIENQQKFKAIHRKVHRRSQSCLTIHQRPQWTKRMHPSKIHS